MDIKRTAKSGRDSLQLGIYAVINPFVRMLIKIGVTPNMVTTIGFLGNLAAAVVFVAAGMQENTDPTAAAGNYWMLTLGGALIIGFSLFDMLDGQVARLGGMSSTFGAMYDSVLDRYCELLTLGGIAFYLLESGDMTGVLITFVALVGSIMVSYVRARAEGLDIECKIGFMQRPERVVVTALGALAAGLAGSMQEPGDSFDPNVILIAAMSVIAVFANLTAFARLAHCRRQLTSSGK